MTAAPWLPADTVLVPPLRPPKPALPRAPSDHLTARPARGRPDQRRWPRGSSHTPQTALRSRIARPLSESHHIAVVTAKGGAGRTTITVALGTAFARHRHDRVTAVDASPAFGDLAARAGVAAGPTLRDLAAAPSATVATFAGVRHYATPTSADLDIIASPHNSASSSPVTGAELGRALAILHEHYALIVTDCSADILHPATVAAVTSCHALVVVAPPTPSGVVGATTTCNWLHAHGLDRLLSRTVVAVPCVRRSPTSATTHVTNVFARLNRPAVVLPFDPHLAAEQAISWDQLGNRSRRAFADLAAALADDFPVPQEGRR